MSPSTIPRLFEKRNSTFLPMHNTDALGANLYKVAGRIVAASVLQGGPGFPFFSKAVYTYFQSPMPDDFTEYLRQDDVVDQDYLNALVKVEVYIGMFKALIKRSGAYCSSAFFIGMGVKYISPTFHMCKERNFFANMPVTCILRRR